jgi:hypothetical protein
MRILASRVLIVLLFNSAAVLAQPAVAACKAGKVVPDYQNTQCTVGNLLFKFGKQESVMAAATSVTPVDSGLKFSLSVNFGGQVVAPETADLAPMAIAASLAIPFHVQAIAGTMTQVTLMGDLGGTEPPAVVSINLRAGDPKTNAVRMDLHDFSSLTNTFSTPVKAGVFVPMENNLEAHTGKGKAIVVAANPVTITFTDIFVTSK